MAFATYEESALLWRLNHVNDSKNHSGSTAHGKMVSGIGVEVMASTTLLTATKSTASEGLDTSTGHVHPLHWGVKTGQCFKTLCHKHRHVDMLRCSLLGGSWWSPLIPDTCTSHQKSSAPVVPAAGAAQWAPTVLKHSTEMFPSPLRFDSGCVFHELTSKTKTLVTKKE